jgi:hypothetical protein
MGQDWITATVLGTTSLKRLFDEGLGIDETIRVRQGKITGAAPEPGTSASGPQSTSNDSPGPASTPIGGIQPQPPTPDLSAGSGTPPQWLQLAFNDLDSAPVNGGTITEDTTPGTAAGDSGSNIGGGNPPASGACEDPGDNEPFDLSAPGALRDARRSRSSTQSRNASPALQHVHGRPCP